MSVTTPPVTGHAAGHGDGERIQRFRPGQRYVHLLVAITFVALFLSGLPLIFEPLSFLTYGGFSRIAHRVAAVGFMAVPILYLIVDRKGAKELLVESFTYDRDDLNWLMHVGRYALGNAADMPPQGRLNAGQKLHHAAVIVLSAGVVGSGLTMWFAVSSLSASLLAWTLLVHNVTMLALVLLLIGHIYFTVVYKAIDAMHTGYVSRASAQLEHSKWVAELDAERASRPTPDVEDPRPTTGP
jgi:formate dehydrogenase subunit gamma